jgi:hypothetical protein
MRPNADSRSVPLRKEHLGQRDKAAQRDEAANHSRNGRDMEWKTVDRENIIARPTPSKGMS